MAGTLNIESVEAYARQLLNAGILTPSEYRNLWGDEDRAIREGTGGNVTEQDVADAVNQMSLKNSEMTRFQELSDEVGAEIVLGEWESVRQAMGGDHGSFFDNFKAGLGEAKAGAGRVAGWVGNLVGEQYNAEVDIPGGNQTLRDLTRELKDRGYEALPMTMFARAESFDDVTALILEKTDISPADLNDVMLAVNEVGIQRRMDTSDIEADVAANEAIDDKNIENPLYAKNMRAYELLERNYPTKYQFDHETGAIFMTDGTGQVDRSGNVIPFGSDRGSELVGGWDEGGEPDFTRNEPFDGHAGGLAFGKETGWEKMAREMGAPGTIAEGQYFDVLDVINNKAGYGADASRYLSGQDSFLGGYESTYRVKVEETQARSDMRSFLNSGTLGGGTREDFLRINDAGAFFDDMQRWTSVDARRPSYDVNDEWAQFAGLSPENVAAVQARLIEVGALEAGDVVQGVWGPAEAQQMYKWMDVANAKGLQWQDVDTELIREMFDSETAATSRRAAFVPDAYRPMDPARVELTVKDSIRQLLGRDATAEDLQQLGGYLSDTHGASYAADVKAARSKYNMQVSLDESEGSFGQPGAVEDVDYEARYIQEMEKKFAPQLESQQAGIKAGKQQDMGVAMSNLMNRMGGGI